MFSTALEHAHRHTTYGDAVVMEQGRTVTEHVSVTPPRATDRPSPSPPGCRVLRSPQREQLIGRLRRHLAVGSLAVGEGGGGASFSYRRRGVGVGTMLARLSALSTRVRISSVGPLPVLWCEIFTGSHAVISSYDFALGYPVVRAWVEHRHRRNDHYRSSCKA